MRFYNEMSLTNPSNSNNEMTRPTLIEVDGEVMTYIPTLGPGMLPTMPTINEVTVYYRLQISGRPSDAPRKVKIEQYENPNQGSNLVPVEGVNFEWDTEFTIPAGEYIVDFPITIKVDPDMGSGFKNFRLYFRLVDSEDFTVVPAYSTAYLSFSQNLPA